MYKYIVPLLVAPVMICAQNQPVKPVISPVYIALATNDSTVQSSNIGDSNKGYWILKGSLPYTNTVKEIKLGKNTITIIPATKKYLTLGGNYTSAFAFLSTNNMPGLQNTYVQGRSDNGQLTWRGAETGEIFSYGPAVSTLRFDNSDYPYDPNGRLVKRSSGKTAYVYNNSIFRPGFMSSQAISLHGNIVREYWKPLWIFAVNATFSREKSVAEYNSNYEKNINASLQKNISAITMDVRYHYFISQYSNDNSNGFLNRGYQNSLLTPVSFNNSVNTAGFGSTNDNPYFLLQNNGHLLQRVQQTGSVGITQNGGVIKFAVRWSLDDVSQSSNQSLKPGTAFFNSGLRYSRTQEDRHSAITSFVSYNIGYNNYRFQSIVRLNYNYNNDRTAIVYSNQGLYYHYHRYTNDASFTYNNTYEADNIGAGLEIGNKLYQSNTIKGTKSFVPNVSGFFRLRDVLDVADIKLTGGYNSFYSEAALKNSYAYYLLTQLSPEQAFSFMPLAEVHSFGNLSPMQHNEFTSKVEISINYRFSFSAEMFIRNSFNTIFPVYENGLLQLRNKANTRTQGWEITLNQNQYFGYGKDGWHLSNQVSLYTYNNIVTHVNNGNNNTPLAGFNNVYKALVEGQPVGIIVGSTYKRNDGKKMIIGSDGFPLVNNTPSIIGNPIPAYTVKVSHNADWKWLTLNIDWEYQHDGDIWNGTQAVLDYYGRSATSGAERGIKQYVFNGVMQNGSHNTIPVEFYNPSLPMEQNRWVRYGYTGVAESYIQKASAIRIRNLGLAYTIILKKYLQKIKFMAYAENLMIWQAYKGADVTRMLYDQQASAGLDFFNLPSVKSFGVNVFIQF